MMRDTLGHLLRGILSAPSSQGGVEVTASHSHPPHPVGAVTNFQTVQPALAGQKRPAARHDAGGRVGSLHPFPARSILEPLEVSDAPTDKFFPSPIEIVTAAAFVTAAAILFFVRT